METEESLSLKMYPFTLKSQVPQFKLQAPFTLFAKSKEALTRVRRYVDRQSDLLSLHKH